MAIINTLQSQSDLYGLVQINYLGSIYRVKLKLINQRFQDQAQENSLLRAGFKCESFLQIFTILIGLSAFGQTGRPVPAGSSLPTLADSTIIDKINEQSALSIARSTRDSAIYYADLAFEEAKSLRYIHGMAVALSRKSQIAKHFDDDYLNCEKFGKESLRLFDSTGNKDGIDTVFYYLFKAVFSESRFDDALKYGDKYYTAASLKNDKDEIFRSMLGMFAINRQSGDYEKSFYYAQQLYEIAVKEKNKVWTANALWSLAQLYKLIEDYPTALNFYRKVLEMSDAEVKADRIHADGEIWFEMEFAEVFSHIYQYDSAWHYYRDFKPENPAYLCIYQISTGECYFAQGNFQQALKNFQLGLDGHRQRNDVNEMIRSLVDLANAHLALSHLIEALQYAREGLTLAKASELKQYVRDSYRILSIAFDRLNQTDSSNFYFKKYAIEKEAVLNDQTKGKFAAFTYDEKIALISKEKQIQEIQLQKESLVRNILIGSFIVLSLIAFILFRNSMLKRKNEERRRRLAENDLQMEKLEAEKTRAELMQQKSELEMKALRAQMNPHFIFNCLNSINRYIISNEAQKAADYLTKFAKLIRIVLEQSGKSLVPLDDELNCLQLFMDLEAIRFHKPFQYEIEYKGSDKRLVMIPSLLMQPFVENAIWHGLHPKSDGQGMIRISLHLDKEILHCEIMDNGVGRTARSGGENGQWSKKSMGILITGSRLKLADSKNLKEVGFSIEDLKDDNGKNAGTCVHLGIPAILD